MGGCVGRAWSGWVWALVDSGGEGGGVGGCVGWCVGRLVYTLGWGGGKGGAVFVQTHFGVWVNCSCLLVCMTFKIVSVDCSITAH